MSNNRCPCTVHVLYYYICSPSRFCLSSVSRLSPDPMCYSRDPCHSRTWIKYRENLLKIHIHTKYLLSFTSKSRSHWLFWTGRRFHQLFIICFIDFRVTWSAPSLVTSLDLESSMDRVGILHQIKQQTYNDLLGHLFLCLLCHVKRPSDKLICVHWIVLYEGLTI